MPVPHQPAPCLPPPEEGESKAAPGTAPSPPNADPGTPPEAARPDWESYKTEILRVFFD